MTRFQKVLRITITFLYLRGFSAFFWYSDIPTVKSIAYYHVFPIPTWFFGIFLVFRYTGVQKYCVLPRLSYTYAVFRHFFGILIYRLFFTCLFWYSVLPTVSYTYAVFRHFFGILIYVFLPFLKNWLGWLYMRKNFKTRVKKFGVRRWRRAKINRDLKEKILGLGEKKSADFSRDAEKNSSGRAKKNFERHVKIFGRDGQERLKKFWNLERKCNTIPENIFEKFSSSPPLCDFNSLCAGVLVSIIVLCRIFLKFVLKYSAL